ncbi:MAG: glycoside hydrolase family 3 N-terminal domain-containing protein, partial [Gammaproteobacteria bacterium]
TLRTRARTWGGQLHAAGVTLDLAPVADTVPSAAFAPRNAPIGHFHREFGYTVSRVGSHAAAFSQGMAGARVQVAAKHFPGHGDTHVDSHRDLPTVDKPLAELEAFEFKPFRSAGPQAPAIMTAHIVYPALDPDYPATLSRRILTTLLRKQWDYRGVIITDGMDMHAIAHRYGVGQAAVRALTAGADMVMALGTPATQQQTVEAIAAALADGTLGQEEVDARLARLAALAGRYPCASCGYHSEDDDRALMRTAWRRALTAYRQPERPAPGSAVRLVARQDVVSDGVSEAGVPAATVAAMLAQLYDVELVTYQDAERFDWSALPQDGRVTLLASTSRKRYGPHARSNFKPDLHLALWNPYQALDIDAPALLTYGFAAPALEAVQAWLDGTLDAAGVAPVAGFAGS